MNMTSNKPMSRLNWTRALIRIVKELDYIIKKSDNRNYNQRARLDVARKHLINAVAKQRDE